ncbi:putative rnase p rpr2 rpp21 subunit domain-containing protein [Erysiphe neolycopersici]|uniref:Putative rnase p rpr2 rpp21 subunit domain-containing protein n=1 Tax=Erysiphe neolycopersici TaxID=212602 RepID=A0A420HV83_9PEZI|nr:putative rnase p rpr2 rpp21 subunit domain-containing protein [Erysiphe neolycopersici]
MTKAKNKSSKRSTTIPNKILYSRVSYLYQAAVYLATIDTPHHLKNEKDMKDRNNHSKGDTGIENKATNSNLDTNVNLNTAPISMIASNNAVKVVASNHVKQRDILTEALLNDEMEEKDEKIISKDQDDINITHNLHPSLRLTTTTMNNSRRLVSEIRAVSLKTQIRLSPHIKHSICKSCSTILIDGSTCSNLVENKSKGGKKPWADVLIKKCYTCGSVKRFPISARRQERREVRKQKKLFNENRI